LCAFESCNGSKKLKGMVFRDRDNQCFALHALYQVEVVFKMTGLCVVLGIRT
jgi:hypothetical protein